MCAVQPTDTAKQLSQLEEGLQRLQEHDQWVDFVDKPAVQEGGQVVAKQGGSTQHSFGDFWEYARETYMVSAVTSEGLQGFEQGIVLLYLPIAAGLQIELLLLILTYMMAPCFGQVVMVHFGAACIMCRSSLVLILWNGLPSTLHPACLSC